MVMHCGIKRKLSCMSDEGAGPQGGDAHQHSLLEISVQKLQEEQAKHGIEPRLLRFVLINNAIKALQTNLMDADDSFTLFRDPSTNRFLSNTLSHGQLSSPPSPAKVAKLDLEHFPTDSPLTGNTASFPALGCNEFGDENVEYTPSTPLISGSEEAWLRGSSSNCKRNETRPDGDYKRKRPRNLTLDQLPGVHSETDGEEEDEFPSPPCSSPSTESSSLSPIDFAKVDVSLYDFDARTNLMFPPVSESTTRLPSGLSCSRQAQTFVCTPEPEPPEGASPPGPEEDEDTPSAIEPAPEGADLSNGNSGHTSSSSSVSSLSPEGFDGFDDSHEIDRIVSLLMT